MAFRGRGRGGGGGGYGRGTSYAKSKPVELFPEVALPEKWEGPLSKEDRDLINTKLKLQNFWKSSCYYIEAPSEISQSVDIERFSDKGKPRRARRRENLGDYIILGSFPIELHDALKEEKDSKQRVTKRRRAAKKARPTVGGLEKLDMFEKLEQDGQTKEASDKPKKEEDEEDAEEEDEEEDAEYSDDGDYNQTEYFDDDEDDYNDGVGSDHDDEPLL